jgi:hypothetical protein
MGSGKKILYIILATLIGEIALVLFTTVAQEVLFDGISYNTSSQFDIVFGGLATFIAAILAGVVATLIVKGKSRWPIFIISIVIVIEMTYLMVSGILTDPIWFDTLAGLSLILGIWLGYFAAKKYIFTAS